MPKPRVPTALLEAKGSFLHNPARKRAREHEPVPRAFGSAPSHLEKEEKKVWTELAQKLQPGVAGDSDEMAFEVLVCLVVNFRRRRKSCLPEIVGEIAQMNKPFTQFGMTPSDRSRVKIEPQKSNVTHDPLAEFVH